MNSKLFTVTQKYCIRNEATNEEFTIGEDDDGLGLVTIASSKSGQIAFKREEAEMILDMLAKYLDSTKDVSRDSISDKEYRVGGLGYSLPERRVKR